MTVPVRLYLDEELDVVMLTQEGLNECYLAKNWGESCGRIGYTLCLRRTFQAGMRSVQ